LKYKSEKAEPVIKEKVVGHLDEKLVEIVQPVPLIHKSRKIH
jgi:hypothetical protein